MLWRMQWCKSAIAKNTWLHFQTMEISTVSHVLIVFNVKGQDTCAKTMVHITTPQNQNALIHLKGILPSITLLRNVINLVTKVEMSMNLTPVLDAGIVFVHAWKDTTVIQQNIAPNAARNAQSKTLPGNLSALIWKIQKWYSYFESTIIYFFLINI